MLIVQYSLSDSFTADEDLEFLSELAELADKCLRQANLGQCDGYNIGSGTINVFCTVTDGQRACAVVVGALDHAGIDGAVIAFIEADQEENADVDLRVLWPKDFVGAFSLL